MHLFTLAVLSFVALASGNPAQDAKSSLVNSVSDKSKAARQMNYNDPNQLQQSQQSQATPNSYPYNSVNQDPTYQQQYSNPTSYSSVYSNPPSAYSNFGYQPNYNPYNPQLSTSGNFAIADSGVIFWGVTFVLGLLLALWVVSLVTGKSLTHIFDSNMSAITSRAQDWGFKVNQEDLNRLSGLVTSAIEAYQKISSERKTA